MEKSEHEISVKVEKESPPRQEQAQTNIHLYPDWTTFQAYYGPIVPVPPPYFSSPVTAGHVLHPQVWGPPQTHYGFPYSTIYSQGVVYAHPAVPLVANPLSIGLTSKSSDDIDQSLSKKLKRLDGHAVSVGNSGPEVDAEGSTHEEASQSVDIDASSDGSDGNTGRHQRQMQSNSMSAFSTEHDWKVHARASFTAVAEANITSIRVPVIRVAPDNVAGNSVGSQNGKSDIEIWVKDERQLKRERRKQANRESARRSRLRKQAEIEDLMERYESYKMENLALKSEKNQLTEDMDKARLENAALMEKLNNAQLGQPKKLAPDRTASKQTLYDSQNERKESVTLEDATAAKD
ncbi:hypothetical protein LguiA_034378 [Lonicera macranthoides]